MTGVVGLRAKAIFALLILFSFSCRAIGQPTSPAELQSPYVGLSSENPSERNTALQSLYGGFQSENQSVRYTTRDELARFLDRLPEAKRDNINADLIEAFPDQSMQVQLGTAIVLSKQKVPWNARNFEDQVKFLVYKAYEQSSDETLKRSIDDAVANAKGYYRDAIYDYNNDRIDNIEKGVTKFNHMIRDFPKSRYVPNAIFYLAQYYTKAFLLARSESSGGVESINSAILTLSKFIELPNKSKGAFLCDAYYYLALDYLLILNKEGAISTLRQLEMQCSDRDRIYVYQLFYSKDAAGTVVNKSFVAPALAKETRERIERDDFISPETQGDFASFLKNKLDSDPLPPDIKFMVIIMSSSDEKSAEAEANKANQTFARSQVDLNAAVFAPPPNNRFWGVHVGQNVPWADAQKLLEKARQDGYPAAYLARSL